MPFDALTLRAVCGELQRSLPDCRVDKIHQPTRDSVVLHLRNREGTRRLYLCANPGYPRIHLTDMATENPAQPPMFCMLLRKHLLGGRLIAVEQAGLERCVALRFACTDELGVPAEKRLVAELMGRTSNLILVGPDDRVLDCMRRVDLTMSERRPVLPGLRYELPPKQDKADPSQTDEDFLARLLRRNAGEPLDRVLLDSFFGLSPLLCRELACRVTGNVDTPVPADARAAAEALCAELAALIRGPWQPTLLRRPDGRGFDFSCTPILQYGTALKTEVYPDFSSMLDAFYAARDTADRLRQKSQAMVREITNLRDRTARRRAARSPR